MGSSKRKSSFRIDDILHHNTIATDHQHHHRSQPQQQQQQQNQRLHEQPPTSTTVQSTKVCATPESSPEGTCPTPRNTMNGHSILNNSHSSNNNNNNSSNNSSNNHHHSGGGGGVIVDSTSANEVTAAQDNKSQMTMLGGSPSSGLGEAAPRKPHPVYPPPNFYLPLSLGMPPFSPAAYLEHYANALQKGERAFL